MSASCMALFVPFWCGLDGEQTRNGRELSSKVFWERLEQGKPQRTRIGVVENQKENLDQRFPSLFKKGRRKTVVRNLGKIIYYSKVKFKFQHCQEVNDCYLELFQSYLYFQSVGSNGLTYQGLLPLKELSVCETEKAKSTEREEHAFRITGPLLNPLIVYCPSESELKRWLYHLEKQIHLNGGNLDGSFLSQVRTQRESLGDVLCVSKVKLQHLPFQEQHDRLLILYPSTLVIVSEERHGLYFKGELPLNAIQVHFEENQKSSFLIEGRLINSIQVICPSYEDYQEWLYCLKTAQFRNADSSLSGSESFSGSKPPHLGQLNHWSLGESQTPAAPSSVEKPALPRSPLYADPYTPTPTPGRRVADSDFLEEVLYRSRILGSIRRALAACDPNRAVPGTAGLFSWASVPQVWKSGASLFGDQQNSLPVGSGLKQ
uniref:Pleckstrin homology domain containing N1 n=1 Tax=Chelonoidis abingdonii TaxID=106734 RepID=A0A8C0JD89_CHEAB